MKRFTAGLLNRSRSNDGSVNNNASPIEQQCIEGVRLFCESGSGKPDSGEEIGHLPVIVESSESSPQAAAAAAHQIRKFLSKDYSARSSVQYNAVMLIRILSDHPGETFTRNLDGKFVNVVRDLLKGGKDPSVQQILRETLDALESDKAYDENLTQLLTMWRSEKGRGSRISPALGKANFHVPPYNPAQPPVAPSQQEPNQRVFGRNQLPAPHELASRVEEAKNTAKILLQLVQSTPADEVLGNDLLKEFADRCQTAQRSVQEYINCDSPPPDDDTLQTLIEVNEQLSLALSRHQRAVLSARRATGAASTSPNPTQNSAFAAPPVQLQQQSRPESRHLQPSNLSAPSRSYHQTHPDYSVAGVSPVSPVSHETFDAPPGPPPSHTRLPHEGARTTDPFADPGDTYSAPSLTQDQWDHGAPHAPQLKSVPQHLDRPAPVGAYFQGPTPSYIGRQNSAADGLTMHGISLHEPEVPSVHPGTGLGSTHGHVDGDVSPVETKAPTTYRY